MVETLTPAVCGSRQRYRLALALFTLGALAASAALGAALGLAGSGLDRDWAIAGAAVLASVAAAREAGLLRFPVPEMRRQVPERWRREWPLAGWSFAYGAGLGAGVLTHQAVSTFWIAAAGALALGDPATSAVCLASFGLARALMVGLPTRAGRRDGALAVAGLVGRTHWVRPANVAALVVAAALFGATPAVAQAPAGTGERDPSAAGQVLALAVVDGAGPAVIVRPPRVADVRFPGGRSPSLDGELLVYADDAGLRIVRWRTGEEVARLAGTLEKPALRYPFLAYVRRVPSGQRLELRNLVAGTIRTVAQGGRDVDLGRPALRGRQIAWHVAAGRRSQIRLGPISGARPSRVVASSVTGLQVNPSLAYGHIAWVEQAGSISALRVRRTGGGPIRTLATLRGPNRIFWTTALGLRLAYVTRWNPIGGTSEIVTRRWR